MNQYIFDIPVYRLTHDEYSKKQKEYVMANVPDFYPDKSFENLQSDEVKEKIRDASYYYKSYGGSWRYNEIIGYLRIFKFGNQIRAEYWQTDVNKIVKTRGKQFVSKNRKFVPECRIKDLTSNSVIENAIKLCIERCQKKLKKRYLDLESFNLLSKNIDWVAVISDV